MAALKTIKVNKDTKNNIYQQSIIVSGSKIFFKEEVSLQNIKSIKWIMQEEYAKGRASKLNEIKTALEIF